MKVARSEVQLSSFSMETRQVEVRESLQVWVGDNPFNAPGGSQNPAALSPDKISLSPECLTCHEKEPVRTLDSKLETIRLLLEKMTGRKIKILTLDDFEPVAREGYQARPEPENQAVQSAGYGVIYDRQVLYHESELTNFKAGGRLSTADGREINFELQFELARSATFSEETHLRLGDAKKIDPLVINLNNQDLQLTGAFFYFDLNMDGQEEKLAALGPSQSFLAMDKDHDGRIVSGSELFGPATNDGFGELAQLDLDQNGWIDEADSAYSRLGVWRKDALGNESFISLKQAQIGALYTGRVDTRFSLQDGSQTTLAEMRQSGLYLTEDAQVGSIQELDFVI